MAFLIRKNKTHSLLFRLTLAAFSLAVVVVVLGAFTRLVDAGLGCPDWPGCYGHLLWPNESHEIIAAEAKFPHAPVETDKTWPEMVHRYFAGALGLLILTIAVISVRASKRGLEVPVKLPLFLLAMVILQAAFGMWTVTLKLWPKVVTAHLLGGFTTLSLLCLLAHRLGLTRWQLNDQQQQKLQRIKPFIITALLVVIMQIALGGWVSSNYAALACPDLPRCLGQWSPPTDFKTAFNVWQDIGPNYLGGQLTNHARTAIHLTHRVGAIIVTVVLITLGILLLQLRSGQLRRWVFGLWGILAVQISLGVANILLALPLAIAVAHNAIGAMLLLTMVSMTYRAYRVEIKNIKEIPAQKESQIQQGALQNEYPSAPV